jgi:raffinose/stachyose/melibiose transport system substrate-binding protein
MSKRTSLLLIVVILILPLLAACGSEATATPAAPAATAASGSTGSEPTATTAASSGSEPTATSASGSTSGGGAVTLTYLVDDSQATKDTTAALVAAYTAKHPNVKINIETRPGGTDGDNLVKTRLATGDMDDIFFYNSGSLLQALHPADTLVDISKEPYIANIQDVFLPTVSQNGQIFGVPTGTIMGGGVLYNKKVFEKYGISVPKTWAEFEANNDKLKAAGMPPVLQTYGDTWTSQLFVLADYYNVAQANPNFAADYTANKIKFASDPAAAEGFGYLEEGNKKGWYQKDYATTKFEQGLKLLADGQVAQYPQLSFTISTIATNSPNEVNDIGFFGLPGKDASKAGATVWMPAGTYIPKTSKHIAEAKDFLGFIASLEGVDAITAKVPPAGPYAIKGSKLPDSVLPAVKDIAAYIDSGKSTPALEFFSPLKGPNLEQICVAVGSGQMDAKTGADNYDKDVAKQAQQLGLPGW